MPRMVSAEVTGLKQVRKRLKKLPPKLQRKVLRSATQKAGTVVKKAAQKLAPVGSGLTPDGRPRDNLAKTITRTRAKFYPKSGTVLVVVGPEKHKSPHAHLVHDGTKPHPITLTQPLVLNNVVLPAGFTISHPGAKANDYLDRAVKATRAKVTEKMRTAIIAGIEKETAKLRSKA